MKNKKTIALFLIPLLMFGFGYLLVPIYDVFCELTGLNGKTGVISIQRVAKMKVDQTRLVKVEFIANLNQNLNLEFAPAVSDMLVHPGQSYQAIYHARNLLGVPFIGQAVPSVSPAKAASYFNKVECFCFGQQAFMTDEQRELPVQFVIHPNLPPEIDTITLAYTFFKVPDAQRNDAHTHAEHSHTPPDEAVHQKTNNLKTET